MSGARQPGEERRALPSDQAEGEHEDVTEPGHHEHADGDLADAVVEDTPCSIEEPAHRLDATSRRLAENTPSGSVPMISNALAMFSRGPRMSYGSHRSLPCGQKIHHLAAVGS